MKAKLFILLFYVLFQISIATGEVSHPNWNLLNSEECGNSNAERIVGGKNASMGQYPWIARLGYAYNDSVPPGTYMYKCGGVLVSRFYVVTAAHCVANLPPRLRLGNIRLGEHNVLTDPDCEDGYCGPPVQDLEPDSIVFHKQYNNPLYQNDIAVIRLKEPASFNEYVVPICLIADNSMLEGGFVGQNAEVAGWGIFNINTQQKSTLLQTVTLPILDIKKCQRVFRRLANVGPSQLCVGGVEGKDSCAGDSGGPLMKVEDLTGLPKYYLIGVVSFGVVRCGEGAKPAVYTNIASYTDWILDNIQP